MAGGMDELRRLQERKARQAAAKEQAAARERLLAQRIKQAEAATRRRAVEAIGDAVLAECTVSEAFKMMVVEMLARRVAGARERQALALHLDPALEPPETAQGEAGAEDAAIPAAGDVLPSPAPATEAEEVLQAAAG